MRSKRKGDGRPARPARFLPARFFGDRRGATAVEFAMLAIPLIAILMAALQTAIIFFFNEALQTLTINVGRQLLVGSVQSQSLTQAQFKTLVCNAAPSAFACSGLMVDVQSASSFSNLSTASISITYDSSGKPTNNFSYSPGSQGSAVILRIMYDWPVFGGPLGIGLANQANGSHLMVGTTVFKTEPY